MEQQPQNLWNEPEKAAEAAPEHELKVITPEGAEMVLPIGPLTPRDIDGIMAFAQSAVAQYEDEKYGKINSPEPIPTQPTEINTTGEEVSVTQNTEAETLPATEEDLQREAANEESFFSKLKNGAFRAAVMGIALSSAACAMSPYRAGRNAAIEDLQSGRITQQQYNERMGHLDEAEAQADLVRRQAISVLQERQGYGSYGGGGYGYSSGVPYGAPVYGGGGYYGGGYGGYGAMYNPKYMQDLRHDDQRFQQKMARQRIQFMQQYRHR